MVYEIIIAPYTAFNMDVVAPHSLLLHTTPPGALGDPNRLAAIGK
jgi:hypothetical protein